MWVEAKRVSAAYQNSSADPLRFCLIDNHADSLKLLKEHENQLVLAGELFVVENLKKHVTSDMFFAYELLYQRITNLNDFMVGEDLGEWVNP